MEKKVILEFIEKRKEERRDGLSEQDRPGVSYTKSGVKVIRLDDIVRFFPWLFRKDCLGSEDCII